MPNTIVTNLQQIASNTASNKGFEVSGVEIHTHLKPMTIQILIRHSDPNKDVTINDCALLTNPINEAIENSEIVPQPFLLEVSSSGLSELLISKRDFQTFKGFPIEVTYKHNNKHEKIEEGLLHERCSNHLQINLKGKINRIPIEDVIRVRLISPSG